MRAHLHSFIRFTSVEELWSMLDRISLIRIPPSQSGGWWHCPAHRVHNRHATTPVELTPERALTFRGASILCPCLTRFQICARDPVIMARNCEPEIREYVVTRTRRGLKYGNAGRRLLSTSVVFSNLQYLSRNDLSRGLIDGRWSPISVSALELGHRERR